MSYFSVNVGLWLASIIILSTWQCVSPANIVSPPGTTYLGKIACNETKTQQIRTGIKHAYEFTDEFSTETATTTFTFHTCDPFNSINADLQLQIELLGGEVWLGLAMCDAQVSTAQTATYSCEVCDARTVDNERFTVVMNSDYRSWIEVVLTSELDSKDDISYALTMDCSTTWIPPTAPPTTSIPTTAIPTTIAPTTAIPTTSDPTTAFPTTLAPTTSIPTTAVPTIFVPTSRPTFNPVKLNATPTDIGIETTNIGFAQNPDESGGNSQIMWLVDYITDHLLLFIIAVLCLCILCALVVFFLLNKKRKEEPDQKTTVIHMKVAQNSPLPDRTRDDRNSGSASSAAHLKSSNDDDDDEVIISMNTTDELGTNMNAKRMKSRMEGERRGNMEDNEFPELPPMKSNESLYDIVQQTTTGNTTIGDTDNEESSSSNMDGMYANATNATRNETRTK